jgi:diguanylate cyclase (GGDEF)-like protein
MEERQQYVARYGGEEFLSLLITGDPEESRSTAEAMRHAVENLQIRHPGLKEGGNVTVSIGLSSIPSQSTIEDNALLILADQALYAAKEAGRNCVRAIFPDEKASGDSNNYFKRTG